MSKNNRQNNDDSVSRKTKIMSFILLGIMVFSIGGFAMLSSGGNSNNSNGTGKLNDVPLRADLFQNSQTGEKYWGAVKSGERFIFSNGVEGFDGREDMENLANDLKSKIFINIYIEPDYVSYDSVYIIEKALNALKIPNARISGNITCNSNTLAFVLENSTFGDGCLKFSSVQGDEFIESDVLVYHLIK